MATASTFSGRTQSAAVAEPSVSAPVIFLGRLLFTVLFVIAGMGHFFPPTAAYAASQGVPMASILVPLSGVLAWAGAFSILLGYRAKIGAWLLVAFLVPVTLMMHKFWGVTDPMMHQMQFVNFLKNMSLAGGALLISQFGAGPWSLDARRK